jgi:hypothetical protein
MNTEAQPEAETGPAAVSEEATDAFYKLEQEIKDDFEKLKAKVEALDSSRFISAAKTKLDEAWHWVRDHLEERFEKL